jgi:predicted Zn-dependent protease
MKLTVIYSLVFFALVNAGCSLFGDKTTNGFNEVLYKPPFKAISDSIDKFPGDAGLLLRRAELLSQNNQQDIAYYDYKKSWELKPTEQTNQLFAASLFLTGRNNDAIELLKTCLKRFPDNRQFTRRLAEAYSQKGRDAEALGLYDEILQKDSSDFEAMYEKGMLYAVMKDTSHAIGTLEQSYRLQPVMQTGLALANLYASTKNPRTLDLCNALEARDSSKAFVDPVFLKGIYFSNIKDYARALPLFDECVNRDWRFIEPYIEKGIIFYEQKDYPAALKEFGTAINIDYSYADAYFWTGRCYEATGKKTEALDYYYKALAFDKNFTEARAAIDRLKK